MANANSIRRNSRFIDLTGQRFGKWTVVDEAARPDSPLTYWNVLCDCGRRSAVPGPAMRRGRSSCCTSCRGITHGKSRSPEYEAWHGMRQRCTNPSHKQYADYGGRGINVCDEWDSFAAFYADMGSRPSGKHTIERIDNSRGYYPDNCEWATRSQQLRNTRRNRLITFNGKTMCMADWAIELGLHYKTLQNRINRGWTLERALARQLPG